MSRFYGRLNPFFIRSAFEPMQVSIDGLRLIVSIPSSSGPRLNVRSVSHGWRHLVSIPSSSGPRLNRNGEGYNGTSCLNPIFIRSAFERSRPADCASGLPVSIPSSSGPRLNNSYELKLLDGSGLNPFFIRSAFERLHPQRRNPHPAVSIPSSSGPRLNRARAILTREAVVSIPSSSGPRLNEESNESKGSFKSQSLLHQVRV